MDFLYFLEGLRTPFFDALFSIITRLGEETFFIVLALLVSWCVDKRMGYLVLTVGFFGTVANQFLKLACRVERPWVLDQNFRIVESARAGATGFSFPSGHTQNAVGTYGVVGLSVKRRWIRLLCLLAVILVPFSRLYLGVHTPLDVGVAALTAALLIALFIIIFKYIDRRPGAMYILFGAMLASSAAFLLYSHFFAFPQDTDAANLLEGQKNAASLLGMVAGLCIAYPIEKRFIKFSPSAPLPGQALKLLSGLLITFMLKSGLKAIFAALFGAEAILANIVRYAAIVVFAIALWPLTFRFFEQIGKRNADSK